MRAVDLIEKKRNKEELSKEEISFLLNEYLKGNVPDYQMSAFLMAVYFNDMSQEELLKDVLSNVTALRKETKSLEKEIARVSNEEDLSKQTDLAKEKLISGLEALRVPCDNLEKVIEKDLWKFPTYTDLLFKL